MSVVLKINRIGPRHIRKGRMLVVPDPIGDFMALSPFPHQIEAIQTIPKLLLISCRVQAFGAYEFGQLIRWGPTSTGRKVAPTPAGLYHANWKSKKKRSTVNRKWLLRWCFNLDTVRGISIHQYDLPGYPASHACVRLLGQDAYWVYNWAEGWLLSEKRRSIRAWGTPVLVFGKYPYGKSPPWKRLPDDPNATTIAINEIEDALRPYLPIIQEWVQARDSVLPAVALPLS